MAYTMITEHHNYDHGYIALVNLELNGLPEAVTVDGYRLLLKDEFHISIMAVHNLASMLPVQKNSDASKALKGHFLDFAEKHNLTDYEITPEFRLVERGKMKSVVVMVKMPEVEELFRSLRDVFQFNLPTQPTHITLYTLQPNNGIGILSQKELLNDSKAVSMAKLYNLLK